LKLGINKKESISRIGIAKIQMIPIPSVGKHYYTCNLMPKLSIAAILNMARRFKSESCSQ